MILRAGYFSHCKSMAVFFMFFLGVAGSRNFNSQDFVPESVTTLKADLPLQNQLTES